jgi:hypothetical protein
MEESETREDLEAKVTIFIYRAIVYEAKLEIAVKLLKELDDERIPKALKEIEKLEPNKGITYKEVEYDLEWFKKQI